MSLRVELDRCEYVGLFGRVCVCFSFLCVSMCVIQIELRHGKDFCTHISLENLTRHGQRHRNRKT